MPHTLDRLQTVLEQERNLVREFITALETEARVLSEPGDDQALAESTATKNRYADQLAATGEQRQALLSTLGYSADKAGLDALTADHPALQSVCTALLDQARQASELNTSNGIIIDTFLTHNQQTLETLRSLASVDNLYDANGRSKSSSKGQTKNIKAG